jgi:protein SCO1/2
VTVAARTWRGALGALVAAGIAITGCSGEDRELVGYTREPAPDVADVALPDVADDGREFAFRAPAEGLLVVFFGYTQCPDVCPTTLANVRGAREDLGDDAERVSLAMVTVDPERDTDVLAEYVRSFVPAAHALATDDGGDLQAAADRFGVSYQVAERPDGEVEVAHTDHLFAVDDTGTVVLTWPSGTERQDLAADLEQLLRDTAGS